MKKHKLIVIKDVFGNCPQCFILPSVNITAREEQAKSIYNNLTTSGRESDYQRLTGYSFDPTKDIVIALSGSSPEGEQIHGFLKESLIGEDEDEDS